MGPGGAVSEQHRIAGTDLTVSRGVFGAMTFGSQVDQGEADWLVRRSLEAGITTFDTANSYNAGASEEILGRALKDVSDDIVVCTKVGNRKATEADESPLSKKAIKTAAEASLQRLGRDQIDIYVLHQPDWEVPIEETLQALDELIQEGKVRAVGQSNYAAWQITEMHSLAEHHGWSKAMVSQPMYNLLARRIEEEYLAASKRLGLTDITYNPLAGGLLTGKHRIHTVPKGRFSKELYRQRYWNQEQFIAVERLRGIGADAGMGLIELSFRWLFAQEAVDCVLLGASSKSHLESNLAAIDGPAPDADTLARCDEVWSCLRGPAPAYNR